MAGNPRLIDLAGQRFGNWLVIGKAGNTNKGAALWHCVCDCGHRGTPTGTDLRSGKTRSCGCAADRGASLRTHGRSGTRLHRIWKAMRNRCNNPSGPGYANYGGRGIAICAAWEDFTAFEAWALANGYAKNLSIERKCVDGDYTPSNCTWATALEQSINRRFVRRSGDGEAWCEVAKRHGIKVTLMHGRIHDGWPIELAATLPKGSRRPR